MLVRYVGAFIGLAVMASQPAVARSDMGIARAPDFSRPAAFGGFTVRLALGQQAAKPEARLRLTTYRTDVSQQRQTRMFNQKGLELGFSKGGKALLFAGRQSVDPAEQKNGLNTGTTLLIVGGVLVAIVVVALAAGGAGIGDTCPEVGGSRDHCINP